LGRAAAGRS